MFLVFEFIEGKLKDNEEKLSIFPIDCLLSISSVYSINTCSQGPPKYLLVLGDSAINRIYSDLILMETIFQCKETYNK